MNSGSRRNEKHVYPPPIAPPEVAQVKRYQMVCNLGRAAPPCVPLPPPSRVVPWTPALRDVHARVQYLSFHSEEDATLFPSFRDNERCVRLIDSLSSSVHFDDRATLLLAVPTPQATSWSAVATIQVMRYTRDEASIVNIAVLPQFRRRGLGAALLAASLHRLHEDAIRSVALEVTATNVAAIKLYHRFGFHIAGTLYKEVALT